MVTPILKIVDRDRRKPDSQDKGWAGVALDGDRTTVDDASPQKAGSGVPGAQRQGRNGLPREGRK